MFSPIKFSSKNLFKIGVFFSMFFLAFAINAGDKSQPYDEALFNQAQSDNKMIVVDVYKDGCGTCAKQKPTLHEAQTTYPNAAFFRVDFANDKDAVKRFRAIKQSTIIVYSGDEEKGRVLGETNREKLLTMIAQGAS